MTEHKDNQQLDGKELIANESSDEQIRFLTKTVDSLSTELERVKENLQKRKSENTTLKVLFYTGLLVLLVGFLYSNSVLQRAHMRSLEKNIISLEQRLSNGINQVKMNMDLNIQEAKKELKLIEDVDIFTVLSRMDYAISQLHPEKEQTVMLVNQVRLDTDEFTRLLKNQTGKLKFKLK
ncbi:uncharacterized protein METZ01_LOCUS318827 [marine metagenome]|uniref:Uncharacterized protein n=1 Tax=marine metagenome TaxID=408172 RepID=A0A382NXV0_9ZZZZ